jgi:hypothetical protein
MSDIDDPRREFLVNALTAGAYAVGAMGIIQPAWSMGKIPKELIAGKSIYDMSGQVYVDGKQANESTLIGFNSVVETRSSSHVVFAVGKDAFVLRSNGKMLIKGKEESGIITNIRLIGGKLLSVFGKRPAKQKLKLGTTVATIGIRGTGVYVESEPQQSYVCTCYGEVDIFSNKDSQSREQVVTQHHESPKYILANASPGQAIIAAPMINHTDDELAVIEALVGRTVPFASSDGYGAPRKTRY